MAKLSILAGTTSKTVKIFVQNSSLTTGVGLTGLTSATSGLTAYYIREGAGSTTQIVLTSATLGTFTSSGFILVDATNMPGVYELGIPNAAIAASAKSVIIYLQGAANMAPVVLEIELTAVDNQSTGFGLANASANVVQIAGSNVSATTAQLGVNVVNWNNTVVATPATAGIPDINLKNIANSAVSTSTAQLGVNVVSVAGAASNIKKNQALAGFTFLMTDSTTHAPKTGVTVTATRSLNGGSFSACANAVSEISNGVYTIDLAAGDLNGNTVMLRFTGTSSDDRLIEIITQI